MARRLFNIISLVSAILLGVTLMLSLATHWLSPWKYRISFSSQFHAGLSRARGDFYSGLGDLVFFSTKESGPLFSLITGIVGNDGKVHMAPGLDRDAGWDLFGVYWRCLYRHDGVRSWTLTIDLIYPFLLFAIAPSVWAALWYQRNRAVLVTAGDLRR